MTAIIATSPPVIIDRQSSATWEDYLHRVENPQSELERVFFNCGVMWIEDIGNEGINHSRFNKLLTMILYSWFVKQGDVKFDLLGGCVLEKPTDRGAAPDEVVYIGGNAPRYQSGESRRVDLNKWRVPDLAVEIADTTLASDLDEKKQLYLTLEVPEYWVVDVRGKRVLAFRLVDGKYQECIESVALIGLSIELLDRTLERMDDDNGNVAMWFAAQIKNLPVKLVE
ncbi:Uma2 family endonuclease [Chamaesiphon sp. VAR_69_metabat_338]|uniref:Uma2 family endonuclease n=1 Tax=Chamaesiphon sp. VAR_69_metabat_338 TaxID=2964704 RepID=UPI00286DCCAE|nr:Uma2 family endonuclease [Chamaesiphon sp. VAR_69_metabat_338]